MKNLKCLFIILIVGLLFYSCEKDKLEFDKSEENKAQINQRTYNQEDCGFIDSFCEQVNIRTQTYAVIAPLDNGGPCDEQPCLVGNEPTGGNQYKVLPIRLYDQSVAIYYTDRTEEYLVLSENSRILQADVIHKEVPSIVHALLSVNYRDINDGEIVLEDIESSNLFTIETDGSGFYTLSTDRTGNPTARAIELCDYFLASRVSSFVDVFFDENDASHIEQFVREAFVAVEGIEACNITGEIEGTNTCTYNCIDPRCVVDELLDIDAGLSEFQKRVLVSRYLQESMGLTDEEQNWLTLNDQTDLISSIYNGLGSNQNLGRCNNEDCGLAGGYHELIKQEMNGETLTFTDTEELLVFFSLLQCDNPEIYSCFRESQQNPTSDIAAFLGSVISMTENGNTFLTDGCDDLDPYTDRWSWLATFDPMNVEAVSDRLNELGDDNWIQTINNATNVNWWWESSPTVNMDFFGITISNFPNKPYPPFDQFSPEEFFEYIQDFFNTENFMGEGNQCHSVLYPEFQNGGEFSAISIPDDIKWSSNDPIASIFEINMFDDGSVITADYNFGQNWTFSTLNAPGWFEGGSYDGFHPVSGNRQFGLVQNSDGTYTFYTSGVDRITGFWHLLGQVPLFNPDFAFEQAEELWQCFLDQIKNFVESNGGTVSLDYDCTNVRPNLQSLQAILKEGCNGEDINFEEFPCHQTIDCP